MKISLSFELHVTRKEPPPEEPQPQGAESMVVHQDQPRFIGFRPETPKGDDE